MVLSIIIIVQSMISLMHCLFKFCKRRNQVIQINLPNVQNAPIWMNNQAYNADLATLKEIICMICCTLALVCYKASGLNVLISKVLSHATGVSLIDIQTSIMFCQRFLLAFFLFLVALTFYVKNPSLRVFAHKLILCNFNEI